MVKWKLAALMAVVICSMLAGKEARAQQAFTGVDGCAVLGRLILAEVTADAWNGPIRQERPPLDPGDAGVTICTHTTRTVSEAYVAARRAVGEEVRWGTAGGERGDACLSGFLEQCYPDRYPVGGENHWRAVSRTVLQAMPRGVASDQSVFSPRALRLALRAALARDQQGP